MTEIGYRAASLAARRLPGWLSDPLAAWCADVYVATHPVRARAVDRRLARLWKEAGLGDPPPDARATYRAFARALRDFLALGGGPPRRDPVVRLDAEAVRHLASARAAGLSTLVVSAHFGPWETALQWLARQVGPVDAIAAPHRAPSVERFFRAHRAAFGIRTLSTGHPAAAALARLREGGWIAVLADRAWRDGDGRAALGAGMVSIDPAPLFLARRARAQVLAGVAWRESDGAVAVRFHPPFILGAGRGDVEIAEARSAIEGFFDAHVRAHPTQWFDWGTGATADPAR
ncbi:MAG TPA: lysophospholipid acyltransferase family protein [Candidatus Eisenbacteria bacterium]